ncbi:MAG: hypothetical protein AB7Q37_17800 [Pyrinomonadaceae bacterium]
MKFTIAFVIFVFTAVSFAQGPEKVDLTVQRKVKGNAIISKELPAATLRFPKGFRYAGGHAFILYDVARAEQHFYVDADADGNVTRMYWIQFEGYLPSNTHAYDYSSPKKVNIGGYDFFADVSPQKIDPKRGRPDSDGNRAREFLTQKGFKIASDEVMTQRLVAMLTPDNRQELMIIYLEVLTPFGVTAADLAEGGKDRSKWPAMADGLLKRAVAGIRIDR